MTIEIGDSQRDVIRHALKVYLSDLREEIVKTEKYDMRQSLHREEDVLKDTIQQLS